MIKIILGGLLAVACSASSAVTPVPTAAGHATGEAFRGWSTAVQTGFVTGTVDGFLLSPIFAIKELHRAEQLGHCTTGMQSDQMLAIVNHYMDQHPDVWNSGMNTIVFRAFVEACRYTGYPLFDQ